MTNNDLIFSIVMFAGIFLLLRMIANICTASIKAYHENKQDWGRHPNGIPPMFQKMTDKAMAERDELIESLRERIEVLEQIVTDQHNQSKARELADEIDNLNKK